jgi:serine/threonine protein kinase
MSFNHLKYGILSTYEWTFFFRRTAGGSSIEVSMPVHRKEIIHTMCAFLLMLMNDEWTHMSPAGSPELDDAKWFHGFPTQRGKLIQLNPTQFRLTGSHLGWTRFGSVITGEIPGGNGKQLNVVFKTENVASEHGRDQKMQKEAQMYCDLRALQGKVIPVFYGYVDFNGIFRALVMEYCGVPLVEDEVAQYTDQIVECVKLLHAQKVLHGDLDLRNILKTTDGGIRIIDFERAEIKDDLHDEAFKKELDDLNKLLSNYAKAAAPRKRHRID